MKKIIIIALMALVATTFFTGFTSVENSVADTVRPIQTLRQSWLIDTSLMFTLRDTDFTPSKPGIIWFQSAQNFYKWDGSKWSVLSSDTSSTDLSNYWTSTQVQNRLDDTAAAIRADFPTGGSTDLSAYSTTAQTKQLIGDTATTVRAAIPTSNGGLTNTAGYQTKDSLTAHAVTTLPPLLVNNDTLSLDTSVVATVQALRDSISILMDSIADLRTSVVSASGLTLNQVLANGNISGLGAAFGDLSSGTGEITGLTVSTIAIQSLSNKGDSMMVVDTAGKVKQKHIDQVPDIPYFDTTATAYTLSSADKNRTNDFISSSAVTVTVPLNSSVAFSIGSIIIISRGGSGTVTISPTAGVTIQSVGSSTAIAHQYGEVYLQKIGTDTWRLIGDL